MYYQVPDLKPTVKSPTRPPSTPGHNKTKSSTVKSPPKPSSPASTKIKSPAKIPSQEKSTVDNVDGTPKVQKKKKVISSPDKNMAENKCEEKPKERKRSTKEMEENVTKTPKASIKPQVTFILCLRNDLQKISLQRRFFDLIRFLVRKQKNI